MHSVDRSQKTTKPHLSIQSASFHWQENVSQLTDHFNNLKDNEASRLFVVTHSTHEDFSDFPILFTSIMKNKKVRGVRKSEETKDLYIGLTVEFLANNCTSDATCALRGERHLEGDVEGILKCKEGMEYLQSNSKLEWNS